MPEYIKKVKDLTIEDLERMRDPDVLGEEADFMIGLMRRAMAGEGLPEEQLRTKTLEEVFPAPDAKTEEERR
jgi:hypothetical protein